MKQRTTRIALWTLLGALALAPAQAAAAQDAAAPPNPPGWPAVPLKSCGGDFPSLVEWVKVSRTGCSTAKRVAAKMRKYVQAHKYGGGNIQNGYFVQSYEGFKCRARFIGSDEVLEWCQKRIPGTTRWRLIKAFVYAD